MGLTAHGDVELTRGERGTKPHDLGEVVALFCFASHNASSPLLLAADRLGQDAVAREFDLVDLVSLLGVSEVKIICNRVDLNLWSLFVKSL